MRKRVFCDFMIIDVKWYNFKEQCISIFSYLYTPIGLSFWNIKNVYFQFNNLLFLT